LPSCHRRCQAGRHPRADAALPPWKLRDEYYPGDLGFDPLGFKPSNPKKFADMQTKELQNGRLAMIGAAGMCAQEIFNHRTILGTIDFYEKVNAGINPYNGCADGVIC